MKFRVSLRQLFLIGLLATPIWGIVFVAFQGQEWGIGALYGQLISMVMLLLLFSMFLMSDRLAALLYRRRAQRIAKRNPSTSSSPTAQSVVVSNAVDVLNVDSDAISTN